MGLPASTTTSVTLTGDTVIGPGAATVLINNLPATKMGDAVAGPACSGSVVKGSTSVLVENVPLGEMTGSVAGANPATGVPVSTAIGQGQPTTIAG